MTSEEYSIPFVALQEKADNFLTTFHADINTLLTDLDSKITVLSRNGTRLNAHSEFLKVESLVKRMQANWIEQINNIVSDFSENAEIILAETNLETSPQSVLESFLHRRNEIEMEVGGTGMQDYSSWLPLDDIDDEIPEQPGIYELKVANAKKSAYIGSCDNLRKMLTLHKRRQISGNKQLEKFLIRNKQGMQVSYEGIATTAYAEIEKENRIKAFVAQHKTTPAYN